jgi:hypothetical protein
MNIIFLDVDGVLNNFRTRQTTSDGWCFVDGYLVARLKRLLDLSGARLVLSSTWREGWHQEDESKNDISFTELREKFHEFGIEIFDRTGEMRPHRWQSIKEFLARPREDAIEHFVILDDWNDMGEFSEHLVLVNPSTGLTEVDIQKALKILEL